MTMSKGVVRSKIDHSILSRALVVIGALLLAACASVAPDPLPSWNEGANKRAIIEFVRTTSDPASPKFVQPAERIAAFDQDGTTWVEQPLYTEVNFALARVVELAPKNPGWKDKQPFKAVIDDDRAAMAKFTERDLFEIIGATYGASSTEELTAAATAWIARAQHPRWKRPYTELVFQPMLEVMTYLRANGYKVYFNTGGTQPFVRGFSEKVYGIAPEQVVGTMFKTTFSATDTASRVMIEPAILHNNDRAGKPEGFTIVTGRRPKAAFGNSAGDAELLEFAQGGSGATLQMLVLHDDGVREYAYGPAQGLPDSKIGTFPQSLYDQAMKRGWNVISMKNDWKRIFSWEP
jgi:hypothetical protein